MPLFANKQLLHHQKDISCLIIVNSNSIPSISLDAEFSIDEQDERITIKKTVNTAYLLNPPFKRKSKRNYPNQ